MDVLESAARLCVLQWYVSDVAMYFCPLALNTVFGPGGGIFGDSGPDIFLPHCFAGCSATGM